MCRVLRVSRSGYYAWTTRPLSAQATERLDLFSELHAIHSDRKMHVYGSPRVHQELLNRGFSVCENTVAKLMSSEGIASSTAKKFRVVTTDSGHSLPVAENILDRDVTAAGPGRARRTSPQNDLNASFQMRRNPFSPRPPAQKSYHRHHEEKTERFNRTNQYFLHGHFFPA